MMKLAVICANGKAGRLIVKEAVRLAEPERKILTGSRLPAGNRVTEKCLLYKQAGQGYPDSRSPSRLFVPGEERGNSHAGKRLSAISGGAGPHRRDGHPG